MHKSKSSDTAEGVAAYRAVESMRSEKDRVIYDPYAQIFLGNKWQKIIYNPIYKLIMKLLGKFKYPGFYISVIARVRFMNECIKQCFPGEYTQLVILGAGYDMSAYCFRDILPNARIFEVDHPSTQKDKLAKIKENIKDIPDNITYIPVNFEMDDLKESLISSGYAPSEKTLFIWEGVTYYLEKESVEQMLEFIVENSARGSKVAFDYFPPEVIDGTSTERLGKVMYKMVKKLGEPYKFGITVEEIDNLLKKHHFTDIGKYSSSDVRDTYFHGDYEKRKVTPIFNFVCATT
ncbi:MAG: class I SAM-dependent methyltransferase [Deltaproteobacteria bacterium]|jgi:methyltransferase (TIGR00027 family)|nr:class I SAM-dependent methyltransferase [Deltaproteobacteria bacterium]